MSLSYTTGNPNNLTGGGGASMNDIQGPFVDIKTFLTDGSGAVNDTILASPTSPVWRTVCQLDFRGGIAGLSTTPCFVGGTATLTSGSSANAISGLWVPPSAGDIAVAGKTTRLRVRAVYSINATGPGVTVTWGLYPITSVGGAISSAIIPTLGTVIAGSGAAVASPTGGTGGVATGSSFDFSAVTGGTGGYCLGVVASSAMAGNSLVAAVAYLEMRHT